MTELMTPVKVASPSSAARLGQLLRRNTLTRNAPAGTMSSRTAALLTTGNSSPRT